MVLSCENMDKCMHTYLHDVGASHAHFSSRNALAGEVGVKFALEGYLNVHVCTFTYVYIHVYVCVCIWKSP